MKNIILTQSPAGAWRTDYSTLTRETARLARGNGNPSWERPAPRAYARAPIAKAIERFASIVAEKILRTAGIRKGNGKSVTLHARTDGKGKLVKVCFARPDATPARTWDYLRPELQIEARSAIGARIALNPSLADALLARVNWPKQDLRAVFGDTQKLFRHFRRGAQNLCADAPELTDAQRAKNGLAIAAQEHDATAREQRIERLRFARLRMVLRALHAWRTAARASGQRNVTRGFEAARALVANALAGNPLGRDYLDGYQAFRDKVYQGLCLLGWEPSAADAYLPASLPATPCSMTAKTV